MRAKHHASRITHHYSVFQGNIFEGSRKAQDGSSVASCSASQLLGIGTGHKGLLKVLSLRDPCIYISLGANLLRAGKAFTSNNSFI